MAKLSPTVENLFNRIRNDKEGALVLSRVERRAAVARRLRDCAGRRNMSYQVLATKMGTSVSQVQRLFSMANVTLDTLLKAAEAMELQVDISVSDPLESIPQTYHD